MNKQHIIVSVTSFIAGLTLLASPVHADSCFTQYGGGQTCRASDLIINKQVKNPITNVYVENLTTTDPTFAPGSEIDYRLIITNNSGETFNPVNVSDTLPPYVTQFIGGKPGSGQSVSFNFDTNTHVLTFSLSNLIAGETRSYDLQFRVADASQFPAGKSLFCVTNEAQVSTFNRNDQDNAQACLQNGKVPGITTLPVAGFNDFAMLLPFAGVALGGFALLKKRG
jgi:uncharacterized repeat protein (TIGR01451 family)